MAEAGGTKAAGEKTGQALRELMQVATPEGVEAALSDEQLVDQLLAWHPQLVKAYLKMLSSLETRVAQMPPEQRAKLLQDWVSEYDAAALVEALNGYTVAAIIFYGENPEMAREFFPAVDQFMSEVDFGKVRVTFEKTLAFWTAVMGRALQDSLANPVIAANLMGMIPPLANSVLELLYTMLENMSLPPEILASAVFNMLSAVDAETLGKSLTLMAGQIKDMHEGNLILGRDEPRFRAVFAEFMKRLTDNLDAAAMGEAAAALGEDLEVVAQVLTELWVRDPELLLVMTRTGISLTNSLARVVGEMLAEAGKLPAETLTALGEATREGLDIAELGGLIDLYVNWDLAFRDANPGLNRELMTKAFAPVNTERLELLLREIGGDCRAALIANPGVRKALEPEEVARRLNEAVAGFNRSAAGRPGAVGDYAARLVGAIDVAEFQAAARNVSGGIIDAMFVSSEVAASMLGTIAHNAWKVMKHLAAFLIKKLTG